VEEFQKDLLVAVKLLKLTVAALDIRFIITGEPRALTVVDLILELGKELCVVDRGSGIDDAFGADAEITAGTRRVGQRRRLIGRGDKRGESGGLTDIRGIELTEH